MNGLRELTKTEKQLIRQIRLADRRRDSEEVSRLLKIKLLRDRERVHPA